MRSFCEEYDFSLDTICSAIRRRSAKRVLIQLPEGFLRCSELLADKISRCAEGVEVIISLNPAHGSCLVDEEGLRTVKADLLIHVGHVQYPLYSPRVPALFVPAEYVGTVRLRSRDLLEAAEKRGAGSMAIYSTAQHQSLSHRLASELKSMGIKADYMGVVTGCIPPRIPREVGLAVVVAGGVFHALGLGLRNVERADDIVAADPYTGEVRFIGSLIRRVLKVRYWKVATSRNAKVWLLINGFYGQYRALLEDRLCRVIQGLGRRCIRAVSYVVTEEVLRNLDSDSIDVFVVLSCPRVAIDDLYEYPKPVLTPGEALMALQGIDRYVYPW